MANKDFKVKNGLDIQTPLPVSMGGTGQTSTTNTLNSLLPSQDGNNNKVLATDGTNTTWVAQSVAYQRGGTASRPASPTAGDLYYNTDNNYFESYTANGWFPIAAAPGIPTSVVATNQPSGRAYNNGKMSVVFSTATNAGAPSSFIVTPTPTTSPTTFTGSSSPIEVTGLASSTQYTYTVVATSPYGTSSASSASTGVTATTVPQAPSISATGGNAQATITITPGATGGSEITGYSIISNPVTTTETTSNTTYTFTGLTNGTSYTFTATATNANGTSAASSASNSITPNVTGIGYLYGGSSVSTINRLNFATDSYSTLSATAPAAIGSGAGSANSGVAGYAYGGYESNWTDRIAKLTFSGETVSTISATIATAVYGNASFSNNGTAGFTVNGHQGSSFLDQVNKLNYSNDTRSLGGTMGPLYLTSGISNKGSAGYTVGGYSWGLGFPNRVYKYTFSNDTGSLLGTTYAVAAYNIVTWENDGTAGYAAGGGDMMHTGVHKMPFSTDTISSAVASLAQGGDWGGGLSRRGNAGYYCLGRINVNTTSKFLFATDTRSEVGGTLTTRSGILSMSNNGVF
jgi:hypothetical protein